ncbi:MAG TPA: ABC transporter ATP-binding protein [Myxococcaceae bacterium]|nr:ABC transporter ATP-binding protein [Myxococcaceae bacterium]
MSENAIEVRGVTKTFRRHTVRGGVTTLKTQLVGLVTGKRKERFELRTAEVLKGVDLTVPAGRTLGVIGRNGSGKSTLLKLLTGIYAPTSGTVSVKGRLSALLELGAGFHPEFSGRENILINGVILGLSRAEIRARQEEIIEFSELGDFIDEPVRTYSSGMYMRLAFAVATLVDPDVLIIDEILAVGDEHFGRKSRSKMEEFKDRGKTIVLVTHDLTTVENWCDAAAWLDEGKIAAHGDPRRVVAAYRQKVAERELAQLHLPAAATPAVPPPAPQVPAPEAPAPEGAAPEKPAEDPKRWGNRSVVIAAARMVDARREPRSVFEPEAEAAIEIEFEAPGPVEEAVFGIGIFREDGMHAYGTNTKIERFAVPSPLPRRGVVRFRIERLCLNEGNYSLDVAVVSPTGVAFDYQKGHSTFAVRSEVHDVGYVRPPHRWEVEVST